MYVFILPEHSSLPFIPLTFPLCSASEASGAICQLRVCVCMRARAHLQLQKECVYYANQGERTTEGGGEKKAEGGCEQQGREGGVGRGGGMEMILTAVQYSWYLCVWASAQELQSQPLIWPLPGNVSVLWFDTVCVWTGKRMVPSFTGSSLWKLEPFNCYLVCMGGKKK